MGRKEPEDGYYWYKRPHQAAELVCVTLNKYGFVECISPIKILDSTYVVLVTEGLTPIEPPEIIKNK